LARNAQHSDPSEGLRDRSGRAGGWQLGAFLRRESLGQVRSGGRSAGPDRIPCEHSDQRAPRCVAWRPAPSVMRRPMGVAVNKGIWAQDRASGPANAAAVIGTAGR
jgi:hypothetical protein